MVNQLRDPAVYEEGHDVYLLYAVAGESGVGIARVAFPVEGANSGPGILPRYRPLARNSDKSSGISAPSRSAAS